MAKNDRINVVRLAPLFTGLYKVRSNTKIVLSKGVAITASNDLGDYVADSSVFVDPCGNEHGRSVFFARGKENIEIATDKDGIINGQGSIWLETDDFGKRPGIIRFVDCKNIKIKNITIVDSPCWAIEFHNCENVVVDGVKILSKWSYHNDGIVIDGCKNVVIKNCSIDTGDDCIAIKTTRCIPSENILIENCDLSSAISAFKIGTETVGDIKNVTVRNCTVKKAELCAIKIVPTDGGTVNGVRFENLSLNSVVGPIFIANGERNANYFRGEKAEKNSSIENVTFVGVDSCAKNRKDGANGRVRACIFVSGTKKNKIHNVNFKNCVFRMPGGEMNESVSPVEEMKGQYPEYYVLGMAPASGAYLRHIDGANFHNVEFILEDEDRRKKIYKTDVVNFMENTNG